MRHAAGVRMSRRPMKLTKAQCKHNAVWAESSCNDEMSYERPSLEC